MTTATKTQIRQVAAKLAACQLIMQAEKMQQGARDGATMGTISCAIDAAREAIAKVNG